MILKWESAESEVIEFTDKSKYILDDCSGFGYPTNNIKSVKSPYQIGNTIIGQVMDPREITIIFKIITDNKDLGNNNRKFPMKKEYIQHGRKRSSPSWSICARTAPSF